MNWYKKASEEIAGGLAEGSPDSDFDPEQLQKGTEIEMEHTGDKKIAKEIAKDHLVEYPKYYDHLKKMEKGLEKKK